MTLLALVSSTNIPPTVMVTLVVSSQLLRNLTNLQLSSLPNNSSLISWTLSNLSFHDDFCSVDQTLFCP